MQGQRIVNLGMIGLGPRGETLLATYFCLLETGEALRFKAICDVRQDRIDKILRIFKAHGHEAPKVYHDYHEMLKDPEIEALIAARTKAKKEKNFAEADMIRDELRFRHIEIIDTPQGTKWRRV